MQEIVSARYWGLFFWDSVTVDFNPQRSVTPPRRTETLYK
jgi:hypothetical protein